VGEKTNFETAGANGPETLFLLLSFSTILPSAILYLFKVTDGKTRRRPGVGRRKEGGRNVEIDKKGTFV